ncbi:MAG: hypothetical protein RLZZ331_160 [Pseudomonadota bacterium]
MTVINTNISALTAVALTGAVSISGATFYKWKSKYGGHVGVGQILTPHIHPSATSGGTQGPLGYGDRRCDKSVSITALESATERFCFTRRVCQTSRLSATSIASNNGCRSDISGGRARMSRERMDET